MTPRYELLDSHHADWRGMRFSTLERALRALAQSIPAGRFYVLDRTTKKEYR